MIQRKQTLYLMAAIILTVMCLSMQIGSFRAAGMEVARVYNLWFTDPLGKHHFDTWPLMAILLPTAVIACYTIFLYHNRKTQALFCGLNALLVVGWYVCYFVVGQTVGDKSWGTVSFRPEWPAVLPAVALILYLIAMRAIRADERLVRSMDRIR
ncbi:MAG: DUF4293 domain-containing protein [Prevotella sp.]|nr:DUF4293 domain-containing protein [Prevotella sp.]